MTETNTKKTWGGARQGAGRPRKKEKRVGVTVRLLPKTRDIIQRLRDEDYDVNQMIDDTFEEAAKDLLLEDNNNV